MKSFTGLTCAGATVLATLLGTVSLPTIARDHGWSNGRGWHGDIRQFERHDARYWHSGAWRHGHHRGRLGWWWVVGGLWYFYPQPVYPYPDPYRPPVVVIEQPAPPVVVQMPPQSAPVPSIPPAPTVVPMQYWYYCEAADGYYPYVASCPSGWRKVPATPPGVVP